MCGCAMCYLGCNRDVCGEKWIFVEGFLYVYFEDLEKNYWILNFHVCVGFWYVTGCTLKWREFISVCRVDGMIGGLDLIVVILELILICSRVGSC